VLFFLCSRQLFVVTIPQEYCTVLLKVNSLFKKNKEFAKKRKDSVFAQAPAEAALRLRGSAFFLGSASLAEGRRGRLFYRTAQLCVGTTSLTREVGFRLRRPALLRRTKPGTVPERI